MTATPVRDRWCEFVSIWRGLSEQDAHLQQNPQPDGVHGPVEADPSALNKP
jgi:hypothetical protein